MAIAHIEKSAFTSSTKNGVSETLQSELQHGEPGSASWWKQYFKWECLTVSNRIIEKGFVITPAMGLTLFLAMAGIVGAMYYRTSDALQVQSKEAREVRDMVIEMKSRLDERTNYQKEAESKREREQKDNEEIAKVWRETITQRMNDIDKKRR